jgi:hypothetical protein
LRSERDATPGGTPLPSPSAFPAPQLYDADADDDWSDTKPKRAGRNGKRPLPPPALFDGATGEQAELGGAVLDAPIHGARSGDDDIALPVCKFALGIGQSDHVVAVCLQAKPRVRIGVQRDTVGIVLVSDQLHIVPPG